MGKLKVKRGDRVMIIAGKDKGKQGRILSVDKDNDRVVVEGLNMITKHQKPRGQEKGGIAKREAAIHVSNVMYVQGGKPTRIGYKLEETVKDGKTVTVKKRIAKNTGEVID